MKDWSATQYLRFEAERTQPARDLLARVPPGARARLVDLGCGPGNSTELLAERFADADIVGLDSSDDMLAKARSRLPQRRFEKADVADWRAPAPLDLIFANAVLQWVPGHIDVMVRLIGQLAPGGCLAVQVPDNFAEPSHVLMREVAMRAPYADRLAGAEAARETIGDFADYYQALAGLGVALEIWRTTYVHALAGPDAIVEWVKSTGLRPYLAPLDAAQTADFLEQYRAEIAAAYAPLADGRVLLPFPRLFLLAIRDASTKPG